MKTAASDTDDRSDGRAIASEWIGIGSALGLVLGVVYGQIALGLTLGAGVGVLLSVIAGHTGDGRQTGD